MRITEIILDKLANTKLFEMARSRKDAKDIVTSLSPQIFVHLLKLFVFDSKENKNHWVIEIDGWLNQIDNIYLKPSNKKPDWQTIYNWLIFDSSPYYNSEFLNGCVRKMKLTNYKNVVEYDYDADVVLNQILKIIEQVSKDLATPNKFITITDYMNGN